MKNSGTSNSKSLGGTTRVELGLSIRLVLMVILVALLAGCPWNTKPNVPEQVTVTVTEYRNLPDWIRTVPVYERIGTTVHDHLNAECRHKVDQMVANCRIAAAQSISAGQDVKPEACNLVVVCEDEQ